MLLVANLWEFLCKALISKKKTKKKINYNCLKAVRVWSGKKENKYSRFERGKTGSTDPSRIPQDCAVPLVSFCSKAWCLYTVLTFITHKSNNLPDFPEGADENTRDFRSFLPLTKLDLLFFLALFVTLPFFWVTWNNHTNVTKISNDLLVKQLAIFILKGWIAALHLSVSALSWELESTCLQA